MISRHQIVFGNATRLDQIESNSIDLVVTSPPYPMIEMWDESFSAQNLDIGSALGRKSGTTAFDLMHQLLDKAWAEVHRVLKPGGFACINIGDATRTINSHFGLYPNHARILFYCLTTGLTDLPAIIWRKQTNAPNKFMGSGMLPAGAYVTLEHEFILILRKGNKREFAAQDEKAGRARSALFWEERNNWFSDVWFDLKGTGQAMNHSEARKRSGAFPFELPYRLINMFSVRDDTVLDPFLGTGTTTLAAMASGRNSIGVEIDSRLWAAISQYVTTTPVDTCNAYIHRRIGNHIAFVNERLKTMGKEAVKYTNENYGFPVVTRQETNIIINYLTDVTQASGNTILATYDERAILDYAEKGSLFAPTGG